MDEKKSPSTRTPSGTKPVAAPIWTPARLARYQRERAETLKLMGKTPAEIARDAEETEKAMKARNLIREPKSKDRLGSSLEEIRSLGVPVDPVAERLLRDLSASLAAKGRTLVVYLQNTAQLRTAGKKGAEAAKNA